MALLDRGYETVVPVNELESGVKWERTEANTRRKRRKGRELESRARALLEERWDKLSTSERAEQLDALASDDWAKEAMAKRLWVDAHIERVETEDLASGKTSWTLGPGD